MLAYVQGQAGHIRKAINSYEKTLQIDASQPDIWLDYGDLLIDNGYMQKARKVIEKAIELHPDNDELHYRQAAYLLIAGEKRKALKVLEKALKKNVSNFSFFLDYDPSFRINDDVINLIEKYIEKSKYY
jgi:crooked neck